MANRGDVGLVSKRRLLTCRHIYSTPIQPAGNSVSNSADGGASTIVVLLDKSGARVDSARSTSGGTWTFYDVGPGTYYALEPASTRQWRIDVDASGAATVTRVTAGNPTLAYASA